MISNSEYKYAIRLYDFLNIAKSQMNESKMEKDVMLSHAGWWV